MLDLLFQNATVIDGTGGPSKHMSVGVKDGLIKLDIEEQESHKTIDCRSLVLCPGFIESHSHGDMSIGSEYAALSKISQGITTEIVGQCGDSPFPIDMRFLDELQVIMGFSPDFFSMPYLEFESFSNFLKYANRTKLRINQFYLVGHNTLRTSVMGVENRQATSRELDMMKSRLREAMEAGAAGMSSGLIYVPGIYSEVEELVELCKVIKEYGGVYATHMRNEADEVVGAVEEAITVAEQSGVPLIISHHKICGRENWGKSKETLRLVDEAKKRGVKILMDLYPYEANMTAINVCIPPWHFSNGMPALLEKLADPLWRKKIEKEMKDPNSKYDNFYRNSGGFAGVFIASAPKTPDAEGKSVAEYAKQIGKTDFDAYFDVVLKNEGSGSGIYFAMDPDEVEKIYLHESTVVGSDGLPDAIGDKGHPRAWGSFIKTLRLYVKEKQLLSLEEAIRKQTSLTADFWGLKNVGRIQEDYRADLVLLDMDKLYDNASYTSSNAKADGVHSVYIAGELVYHEKELTDVFAGQTFVKNNLGEKHDYQNLGDHL